MIDYKSIIAEILQKVSTWQKKAVEYRTDVLSKQAVEKRALHERGIADYTNLSDVKRECKYPIKYVISFLKIIVQNLEEGI